MRTVILMSLMLTACAVPPTGPSGSEPTAVRDDAFAAHVKFLASDLLEGREAGTRGYDLAASYVATQFELLGLQPGGVGDSYFQPLPLRASWHRDVDDCVM